MLAVISRVCLCVRASNVQQWCWSTSVGSSLSIKQSTTHTHTHSLSPPLSDHNRHHRHYRLPECLSACQNLAGKALPPTHSLIRTMLLQSAHPSGQRETSSPHHLHLHLHLHHHPGSKRRSSARGTLLLSPPHPSSPACLGPRLQLGSTIVAADLAISPSSSSRDQARLVMRLRLLLLLLLLLLLFSSPSSSCARTASPHLTSPPDIAPDEVLEEEMTAIGASRPSPLISASVLPALSPPPLTAADSIRHHPPSSFSGLPMDDVDCGSSPPLQLCGVRRAAGWGAAVGGLGQGRMCSLM